jgi:hypothetical protein
MKSTAILMTPTPCVMGGDENDSPLVASDWSGSTRAVTCAGSTLETCSASAETTSG